MPPRNAGRVYDGVIEIPRLPFPALLGRSRRRPSAPLLSLHDTAMPRASLLAGGGDTKPPSGRRSPRFLPFTSRQRLPVLCASLSDPSLPAGIATTGVGFFSYYSSLDSLALVSLSPLATTNVRRVRVPESPQRAVARESGPRGRAQSVAPDRCPASVIAAVAVARLASSNGQISLPPTSRPDTRRGRRQAARRAVTKRSSPFF